MTARRADELRPTAPVSKPADTVRSSTSSIAPAEVPVATDSGQRPDRLTGAVLVMFAVAVGGLGYQAITASEHVPRASSTLAPRAADAAAPIETGVQRVDLGGATVVEDIEIAGDSLDRTTLATSPQEAAPRLPDASATLTTLPAGRRPTGLAAALAPGAELFDRDAARTALFEARAAALDCGDRGWARVAVTFSPSGLTTHSVAYDGDLVGTDVGGCVAKRMRAIQIPAFAGGPQTVYVTVSLR